MEKNGFNDTAEQNINRGDEKGFSPSETETENGDRTYLSSSETAAENGSETRLSSETEAEAKTAGYFRHSKTDTAVKVLRCALTVFSLAVYIIYLIANKEKLTVPTYIITFVCIALFTALGLYAMPVIIRDFTGRGKAYYPENADTKKHFFCICIIALIFYIASTLIGTLMYKYFYTDAPEDFFTLMQNAWMKENTDAQHYFTIAENWYVNEGDDKVLIVFFPLFPCLIRLLNFITGNSYISSHIINITASAAGAGVLYLTFHKLFGGFIKTEKNTGAAVWEDRAFFAVIIALLMPGMIFMCSPMTEPLFFLFTVCCFYFISERKFLIAAVSAAFAGFTRSVGILLVIPIVFEAISDIIRTNRNRKPISMKCAVLIAAAVISCMGTFAYLMINKSVTGDAFKFAEYQLSNWDQSIGFFVDTPRYLWDYFIKYLERGDIMTALSLQLAQLIMIFASLIIYLFAAKRLPASYTLYFMAYFVIAVGCTWLLSGIRYLSLLLPLPAAVAALCNKKGARITAVSVLALMNFVYLFMYMARMQVY